MGPGAVDLRHVSDEQLRDLTRGAEAEQMERAARRGGEAKAAYDQPAFPQGMASVNQTRVRETDALSTGGAGSAPRRGLTLDNVENAFRSHSWHAGQIDRGDQVREALVHAAKVILRNVPDGPDRSTALRKLREVRMDANSAITHNGQF